MSLRSRPRSHVLAIFAVVSSGVAAALVFGVGWAPLWAALAAINLVAYAIWAWDKLQARRGGWRVPEACLHLMAVLGATPASFAAMLSLRHKLRKTSFWVLYVTLTILQVAAISYFRGWKNG